MNKQVVVIVRHINSIVEAYPSRNHGGLTLLIMITFFNKKYALIMLHFYFEVKMLNWKYPLENTAFSQHLVLLRYRDGFSYFSLVTVLCSYCGFLATVNVLLPVISKSWGELKAAIIFLSPWIRGVNLNLCLNIPPTGTTLRGRQNIIKHLLLLQSKCLNIL